MLPVYNINESAAVDWPQGLIQGLKHLLGVVSLSDCLEALAVAASLLLVFLCSASSWDSSTKWRLRFCMGTRGATGSGRTGFVSVLRS